MLYVAVDDGGRNELTVVVFGAVDGSNDIGVVDSNKVVVTKGVAVVVDIVSLAVDSGFVAIVVCVGPVTEAVPALVDAVVVRVVVLEGVDVVTTIDFVVVFVVAGVVGVDNVVAFVVALLLKVVVDEIVGAPVAVVVVVDATAGHERLTGAGSQVQLPPFCKQFRELTRSCCCESKMNRSSIPYSITIRTYKTISAVGLVI